jgi:hypothetical protein
MRRVMSSYSGAKSVLSVLLLSGTMVFGCARHPAPAPVAKTNVTTPAQAAPQGPVIVRLVSRHYTVVVSAGPKSPVYTIHSAAGDLLASNVTLDQLRQTRVDLYDQLAPLISPEGSASAAIQWAGE